MKYIFVLLIALLSTNAINAQNMDEISYSLGVVMAQNLKKEGIKGLNADQLAKAITDVLEGKTLDITPEEASAKFQAYMQKQQESAHSNNKSAGEIFLAANKTKTGITTTDSGLQYEVISKGEGAMPTLNDKVNVHYHGTLITGEVFDSSVERGEPISFPLNGVIQGWQEGLQLMPVGSKYRFFIPQEIAYGNRGAGALIKPYSALIFEVELLGIE